MRNRRSAGLGPPDKYTMVSWLPQFHDMGLIANHIYPFMRGNACVYMSPLTFLAKPTLWLDLMSKHRVEVCYAPDFAYAFCAKRFEKKPLPLDLSALKFCISGAERVRQATISIFVQTFATPESKFSGGFAPSYGLAEFTLTATVTTRAWGPMPHTTQLHATVAPHVANGNEFLVDLKIVDPETCLEQKEDGAVGEIWLRSKSVAQGYWGRPDASAATFRATLTDDPTKKPYLRTGDIGFLHNNHLFVSGRRKAMIIIKGRNYWAEDVEQGAQAAAGDAMRPSCVAAFGDDDADAEALVVVFEIREDAAANAPLVCATIADQLSTDLGLRPGRVVAIRERQIIKTTSGKIRRYANRDALVAGDLPVVYDYRGDTDDHQIASVKDNVIAQDISYPLSAVNWASMIAESVNKNQGDLNKSTTDLGMNDLFDSVNLLLPTAKKSTSSKTQEIEDSITQLQVNYATAVLVTSARHALCRIKGVEATSSLVALGLTSSMAATMAHECSDALDTDIDLGLLLRTDLNVSGIATLVHQQHLAAKDSQLYARRQLSLAVDIHSDEKRLSSDDVFFLLQFICLGAIMCYVSASLIPAYYFALNVPTYYLPLIIIIFMKSLTILFVVAKWLIVGRRRASVIQINSFAYLRWWTIDRLYDLWYIFVGRFFQDTVLINFCYWALGAEICASTKLDTKLYEPDLISIGSNCSVKCAGVYGRVFDSARELRFAPVKIQNGARITSNCVLMPGTIVGERTVLEPNSAAPTGTILEPDTVYFGAPPRVKPRKEEINKLENKVPPAQEEEIHMTYCELIWLETLKIIFIFLYFLLAMVSAALLGRWLIRITKYEHWKWIYRPLGYWILLYTNFLCVSLVLIVLLKWALIGHVSPGSLAPKTCWHKARVFLVDWVYSRIICEFCAPLILGNGIGANLLWKALGVDIGLTTVIVTLTTISASQADLISIADGAFVSDAKFDTISSDGTYEAITVGHAQIGVQSRLHAGSIVENNAILGNQTILHENRILKKGMTLFGGAEYAHGLELPARLVKRPIIATFVSSLTRLVLLFILFFVCLIPSYEIALYLFHRPPSYYRTRRYKNISQDKWSFTPPIPRVVTLIFILPIGFLAFLCMAIILRLWLRFVLNDCDPQQPRSDSFFIAWRHSQILHLFNNMWLATFFKGSRFAVWHLRFLGATVAHDALLNFNFTYEAPLITIGSECVIDDAKIGGHVFEKSRLRLGRMILESGAQLQPQAFAWAGDVVPSRATLGPRAQLNNIVVRSPQPDAVENRLFLQGCPARAVVSPSA